MSDNQSKFQDATWLCEAMASGRTSVSAVMGATLARIEALNPKLRAFHDVDSAGATARARELDATLARGQAPGPLFGLPVAIKSNLCRAGYVTNCGSRMLENYAPPYSATVLERLEQAGAILVGSTHMDEFAMGSSGENSAFATSVNPWGQKRSPGGSSSGSAVAVASGMVPLALGSDTGGSVRQPASFCGLVGFKPTYGRVSRYGLVAFGSSLDQVSPFARSVRDVERVLAVIAGADPMDASCMAEAPFEACSQTELEGLRIGVPKEYFPSEMDAEVSARVRASLKQLESMGAQLVDVSLPSTHVAIPTYYVVATAEASSNLARYDGVRYGLRRGADESLNEMISASRKAGFGPEVTRRILLGTFVLSSGYADAWYNRALRVRRKLFDEFSSAFESCDVIVGPTSPTTAFRLGERTKDPLSMYLADTLTVPASLAGLPALSIAAGTLSEGDEKLPVGVQWIGPPGSDAKILAAAKQYQERFQAEGAYLTSESAAQAEAQWSLV